MLVEVNAKFLSRMIEKTQGQRIDVYKLPLFQRIEKRGIRLGVLDNSKGNADHLLARVGDWDRMRLTDPRAYNIRWLELLSELKPGLERFETVL